GRVEVALKKRNGYVEASVSDTGVGIDREFLPHIFDRFRQGDGSTTRRHGGLGLGLSIVRHLVELHQGKIEVKSAGKNQGATFVITLPLVVGAKATDDQVTYQLDSGDRSFDNPHLLEGLRILVVDDEADTRSLLNMILTGSGS